MSGSRALTPEQKREILDRILAAWLAVPKMRLGQLITCATRGRDVFSDEDYPLVTEVEAYVAAYHRTTEVPRVGDHES
jgi:hypothetical protein